MAGLKNKVKLSPRLQLGIGRRTERGSLLPYATLVFLVISAVLGIRAGYMVFHRSPEVTPPQPQVLGAEDTPTEQKLFIEHSVKSGETVFSIGQQYGVEWTALATLNGLEAPFTLQVGQTLKVPKQ